MLIVEKEKIEEELNNWDPLCLFDKKNKRKGKKEKSIEVNIMDQINHCQGKWLNFV